MVGKVGDMAQVLVTLRHERVRLIEALDGQPAWQALRQLDAREAGGNPLGAVDSLVLRESLAARLDVAVPGWRALAGIETAIVALAALPVSAAITEAAGACKMGDVPPAADAGIRSRAAANGGLHALGAGQPQPPAAVSLVSAPVAGPGFDARAVLGRIRSVDGEPRAGAPAGDTIRVEATRAEIRGTPSAHPPALSPRPAAPPGSRADETTTAQPPMPRRPAVADRDLPPLPPPPEAALVRVPQSDVPPAISPAAPPSGLDGAARVEALAQELERLMLASQDTPTPSRSFAEGPATGLPALADDVDGDLNRIGLEEAEIDIVPLSARDSPTDADDDRIAADADDRVAAGPLSLQLQRTLARKAAAADNHAAFHGIIDEASVEIVRLDEPPAGAAPASATSSQRRPPAPTSSPRGGGDRRRR